MTKLSDWRAVLGRNVAEGRQALRALLIGPISDAAGARGAPTRLSLLGEDCARPAAGRSGGAANQIGVPNQLEAHPRNPFRLVGMAVRAVA